VDTGQQPADAQPNEVANRVQNEHDMQHQADCPRSAEPTGQPSMDEDDAEPNRLTWCSLHKVEPYTVQECAVKLGHAQAHDRLDILMGPDLNNDPLQEFREQFSGREMLKKLNQTERDRRRRFRQYLYTEMTSLGSS
jgi:hypothetical protein